MKFGHKTVKVISGIVITLILAICLIVALPGAFRLVGYLFRLFMPFVLAYIFALIVDPIVRNLQKHFRMPRNITALLTIIVLVGFVGGIVSWAVYKIISEIRILFYNLPQIYDNLLAEIETIKKSLWGLYEILPANIQLSLSEITKQFTETAAMAIDTKSMPFVISAGSFAKSVPRVLVSLIVFMLAAFFMISDFERVKNVVKKPFRQKTVEKFSLVSLQIKKYLGGYIKAQGTIMLVVFFILFLSLSLLKVDFALLIALGTAFLDALPFFGSGAVLWPWCVISFIGGDIRMGVCTIVIYIVILVVRQLIEPKIVSKNIGTSPLLTLISMYLGFRLLSVGGMILGPVIMLLIISLYKAKVFDAPLGLVKLGYAGVKKQYAVLKNKFISFWESE